MIRSHLKQRLRSFCGRGLMILCFGGGGRGDTQVRLGYGLAEDQCPLERCLAVGWKLARKRGQRIAGSGDGINSGDKMVWGGFIFYIQGPCASPLY